MCKKKKFDKIGAKIALAMALNGGKKYRREKRIYYCGDCNAWHLTSKE
jgi:hypothetical protein